MNFDIVSSSMKRLPTINCCTPLAGSSLSDDDAVELEKLFRVLADRNRLKILNILLRARGAAVCVCEFTDQLDLAQPTVSYHLKQLREAGLLDREKRAHLRLLPRPARSDGEAELPGRRRGAGRGELMVTVSDLDDEAQTPTRLTMTAFRAAPSRCPSDDQTDATRALAGGEADLRGRAWPPATRRLNSSRPAGRSFRHSHLADHQLVAIDDSKVVGWAALSPVSERCAYAGVAESSVYVAARSRGRGVGQPDSQPARVASRDGRDLDSPGRHLPRERREHRASPRAAGFVPSGVRERLGQRDGVWRDVLLLERRSGVVT